MNPLPVFVASLKDPVSVATLQGLFAEAPPDVILNATAFAAGTPGNPDTNPLAQDWCNRAPVFQVVLSGSNEEAWATGTAGLSARDIAMNVALPEVDGRVLTRAISFKDQAAGCWLGKTPAQNGCRATGRIGFGELSEQGWPAGEWRGPRYAASDCGCAASAEGGRI